MSRILVEFSLETFYALISQKQQPLAHRRHDTAIERSPLRDCPEGTGKSGSESLCRAMQSLKNAPRGASCALEY